MKNKITELINECLEELPEEINNADDFYNYLAILEMRKIGLRKNISTEDFFYIINQFHKEEIQYRSVLSALIKLQATECIYSCNGYDGYCRFIDDCKDSIPIIETALNKPWDEILKRLEE